MTKVEHLYQELLKREIIRYKDIKEITTTTMKTHKISTRYIYTEYINRLCQQGKLLHPQRGLYVAVPPTMINDRSFQPDKYLIASKLQSPSYLGFHTALEIYGCAYSNYNTAYIVVPYEKKFRSFTFKQIIYQPVYTTHPNLGVKKRLHKNQEINISSPSRTFLDCIDKPDYTGGWEECLKSLEGLSGVTAQELKQCLTTMQKDFLFRKTGLILELFTQNPYYQGILENLRGFLEKHIGCSPMYLKLGSKSILQKPWNLYVPRGFEELLRGV
jgi:predicted transcriptional regulator of viral defense system